MDLLGILSRKLFVPFYNRRHGVNDTAAIRKLMASQFMSEDELKKNQWESIGKILKHAYENNRFYHDRFEQLGMKPGDIKGFDDFGKLPILTKDDIRENREELISNGYTAEQMNYKRTGGSTGVPLKLYWDKETTAFKHALVYRHNSWACYFPGIKQAALWGDTDKKYSLKQKLYMALYMRVIFLDTLNMNDEQMHDFIGRMRRFRPEVLFGHGHSLFVLARFMKDRGIDDIRLKGIISTAETLYPHERAIIEDVFGKIVFDRYGCEEVSIIASECEQHNGLHIAAEGLYVEIEGGDEQNPGRLIITDLSNYGMPFIRYEIGDLATTKAGKCTCGRGLPRIGRVVGRTTDLLYTPDGKTISGVSILDTFTIHIPGLKQTQIVQDKLDHLIFNIVKAADFDDNSLRILAESVPRFFGPNMRYEINFVDKIPLTSRGKFQFSVCKIEPRP
ncbi:MAG: phenylacetate--CoA ligase family protein [Candidatus Zixiibacteriota bacterium]